MKCLSKLSKKKTTLLIDADIFLYRSCAVAEEEICWSEEDDVWSIYCDLKLAKETFSKTIDDLCEKFKTKELLMCISDGKNFRKDIYPNYKSHRKGTRKPLGYRSFVQWCKDTYPSHVEPSLEADDVLGICGSAPNIKTIIISDDKDLKTIPNCTLYRPMSDELLEITQAQADYKFYSMCLTGDPVDGFKGVKGIGEKPAIKVLGNHPTGEQVSQAYIKSGETREEALAQSRCARILRYTDWDHKKNKMILWNPSP